MNDTKMFNEFAKTTLDFDGGERHSARVAFMAALKIERASHHHIKCNYCGKDQLIVHAGNPHCYDNLGVELAISAHDDLEKYIEELLKREHLDVAIIRKDAYQEGINKAIDIISSGSFYHANAPDAKFAKAAVAAIISLIEKEKQHE